MRYLSILFISIFMFLCVQQGHVYGSPDDSPRSSEANKGEEKQESSQKSWSEEWDEVFIDPDDGKFDIGKWLSEKKGFVPIPIIITSPSVGNGIGMNVAFLHGTLDNIKSKDGTRRIPPSISGGAFAVTENGTKFGALYNMGFWRDDTIRSTTILAYPDININFYPDIPDLGLDTLEMNINGPAFFQELKFRVLGSKFFFGGSYILQNFETEPTEQSANSSIPDILTDTYRIGGLSAVLEYDSRNTIFTPEEGLFSKVTATSYDEKFGSDYNFWKLSAKAFYFYPIHEEVVLGFRADGQAVDEDAPFFYYPYIDLEGIPAMRYQGQSVVEGEFRPRWEFVNRWSLLGFIGAGKVYGETPLNSEGGDVDTSWKVSKGLGIRYLLSRKYKMQAGFDVAWGPEDTAFYLIVGTAWNTWL